MASALAGARAALLGHLATLPGHDDFKAGGKQADASLTVLIGAEQNATNTAMAATGIKVETLPAGGKGPEAQNPTGKPKNLTELCLQRNKKA